MRKENRSKKPEKIVKAHETAAILDIYLRAADSLVSIPRKEAVMDAKDWVDKNEK